MVSVCMATCNGARFIREQIDSILPQLAPDDELVISDDGSTDGTLEIIAEYAAADRGGIDIMTARQRKDTPVQKFLRLRTGSLFLLR